MRAALIACVLPILAATEVAAQDRSCGQVSWAMGRPIDLFDEPLPTVESSLSLPKEGVFALILRPVAEVTYPVTPTRGSDGSYGGYVVIESVPAGRYQIALSEEAAMRRALARIAKLKAVAEEPCLIRIEAF